MPLHAIHGRPCASRRPGAVYPRRAPFPHAFRRNVHVPIRGKQPSERRAGGSGGQQPRHRNAGKGCRPRDVARSFTFGDCYTDPLSAQFAASFGFYPAHRHALRNRRPIAVDVLETDTAIEIFADLPGVNKSRIKVCFHKDPENLPGIKIETDDNILTLSVMPMSDEGTTKDTSEDLAAEDDANESTDEGNATRATVEPKVLRRERSDFGDRQLHLPDYVDASAATASLQDGVLKLVIPKVEQSKSGVTIDIE